MANMTFKASLLPNTSNTYSLGSSSQRWKNIYGDFLFAENLQLTGELNVTGNSYLHNQTLIDNATLGNLIVSGATNFVQSPTAPTPTINDQSSKLATTEFVYNAFMANDAMIFKGVLAGGSTGDYGSLTPAAERGYTYKISTAGKINGISVEIGDMFICVTDSTAAATSSNYTSIQNNWAVIQNNIDILPIARGGTGATTENNAIKNLALGLTEATLDYTDSTVLITSNTNGSIDSWYRRPANKMWNYIQGKITSNLYWANINISNTSSTSTSPTFGTISSGNLTIGGSPDTTDGKTIASSSTLYLKSTGNASIIFYNNNEPRARFDTSGHFIPEENSQYNIGSNIKRWKDIYATTLHGILDWTDGTYSQYNDTNVNYNDNADWRLIATSIPFYGGTGSTIWTEIEFFDNTSVNSHPIGVLVARVYSNNTITTPYFKWITYTSELKPEDFVLTYTNTTNPNENNRKEVIVKIWVRINKRYQAYLYKEKAEGRWRAPATNGTCWTFTGNTASSVAVGDFVSYDDGTITDYITSTTYDLKVFDSTGSTSKNVALQYDEDLEVLNFVFS